VIISLRDLRPGESARVVEVQSRSQKRLDRLGTLGLVPGSRLVLQQLHPAPVVRTGETEISMDFELAGIILVERI
jgi:Fe2+ transport system protein FeoA